MEDRLVEVIAVLPTGRYRHGTGCIVAGRTVLTAAHIVVDAVEVRLRTADKDHIPATLDVQFLGETNGERPDLALVEISDPSIALSSLRLARVDRSQGDAHLECHAYGYP